jgi:hypothetical protein
MALEALDPKQFARTLASAGLGFVDHFKRLLAGERVRRRVRVCRIGWVDKANVLGRCQ